MQLWIVEHFFLHKKVSDFLQNPYFSAVPGLLLEHLLLFDLSR